MARKKAANGTGTGNGTPDVSIVVDTKAANDGKDGREVQREADDVDVVKVNVMNLSDLKNACDDAVKRLLSQPDQFTPNHTHTDVKLALGWSSVFAALGTALYGWKVDFEKSKPVVWVGVVLYVLLTAASTLYAYFVEKDTVYVGKRKSLAKRIETEHITISSRTNTSPPSSSTLSNSSSSTSSSSSASPSSNTRAHTEAPHYVISISYLRSSNAGKSLLSQGTAQAERAYTEFFDEEGTMEREVFERWVSGVVERVIEGK